MSLKTSSSVIVPDSTESCSTTVPSFPPKHSLRTYGTKRDKVVEETADDVRIVNRSSHSNRDPFDTSSSMIGSSSTPLTPTSDCDLAGDLAGGLGFARSGSKGLQVAKNDGESDDLSDVPEDASGAKEKSFATSPARRRPKSKPSVRVEEEDETESKEKEDSGSEADVGNSAIYNYLGRKKTIMEELAEIDGSGDGEEADSGGLPTDAKDRAEDFETQSLAYSYNLGADGGLAKKQLGQQAVPDPLDAPEATGKSVFVAKVNDSDISNEPDSIFSSVKRNRKSSNDTDVSTAPTKKPIPSSLDPLLFGSSELSPAPSSRRLPTSSSTLSQIRPKEKSQHRSRRRNVVASDDDVEERKDGTRASDGELEQIRYDESYVQLPSFESTPSRAVSAMPDNSGDEDDDDLPSVAELARREATRKRSLSNRSKRSHGSREGSAHPREGRAPSVSSKDSSDDEENADEGPSERKMKRKRTSKREKEELRKQSDAIYRAQEIRLERAPTEKRSILDFLSKMKSVPSGPAGQSIVSKPPVPDRVLSRPTLTFTKDTSSSIHEQFDGIRLTQKGKGKGKQRLTSPIESASSSRLEVSSSSPFGRPISKSPARAPSTKIQILRRPAAADDDDDLEDLSTILAKGALDQQKRLAKEANVVVHDDSDSDLEVIQDSKHDPARIPSSSSKRPRLTQAQRDIKAMIGKSPRKGLVPSESQILHAGRSSTFIGYMKPRVSKNPQKKTQTETIDASGLNEALLSKAKKQFASLDERKREEFLARGGRTRDHAKTQGADEPAVDLKGVLQKKKADVKKAAEDGSEDDADDGDYQDGSASDAERDAIDEEELGSDSVGEEEEEGEGEGADSVREEEEDQEGSEDGNEPPPPAQSSPRSMGLGRFSDEGSNDEENKENRTPFTGATQRIFSRRARRPQITSDDEGPMRSPLQHLPSAVPPSPSPSPGRREAPRDFITRSPEADDQVLGEGNAPGRGPAVFGLEEDGGGFSQFFGSAFSQEAGKRFGEVGLGELGAGAEGNLLPTPSLLPSVKVSTTQREADAELIGERAPFLGLGSPKEPEPAKQYLNSQGLLTQRRPTELFMNSPQDSPDISTYPSRSYVDTESQSQSQAFGRMPESPLVSAQPIKRSNRASQAVSLDEFTPTQPAAYSPSASKSQEQLETETVHSRLMRGARQQATAASYSRPAKEKMAPNQFVEDQAELSDEENILGGVSGDEDDQSDGDLKELEELVDDQQEDAEVVGEQDELVADLHRQELEREDARRLKIAQHVAQGLERKKRKTNALDDIDSSDDDDENYGRSSLNRHMKAKKRKTENVGELDKCAENPDTKPFAESYADTFQTDPVESQFLQPEENEGSDEDDASSDDGRMRSRKGISVVKRSATPEARPRFGILSSSPGMDLSQICNDRTAIASANLVEGTFGLYGTHERNFEDVEREFAGSKDRQWAASRVALVASAEQRDQSQSGGSNRGLVAGASSAVTSFVTRKKNPHQQANATTSGGGNRGWVAGASSAVTSYVPKKKVGEVVRTEGQERANQVGPGRLNGLLKGRQSTF